MSLYRQLQRQKAFGGYADYTFSSHSNRHPIWISFIYFKTTTVNNYFFSARPLPWLFFVNQDQHLGLEIYIILILSSTPLSLPSRAVLQLSLTADVISRDADPKLPK